MSVEFLRRVPLFAGMPQDDLATLCASLEEVRLPSGEQLFAEGDPGDKAYIIKEGLLEILKNADGREMLLNTCKEGDVIGEMALLESRPRSASVRARTDTSLLAISKAEFDRLLHTNLTATRTMFYTVVGRLRQMQSSIQHSEKMAQLGTLSAGVAHELNNPAAAVARGAEQLQGALSRLDEAQTALGQLHLAPPQRAALDRLRIRAQELAVSPPEIEPLARSDREYEVENWLEERSIPDGWELAPGLVNLLLDPAGLDGLAAQFAPEQVGAVLRWFHAVHNAQSLLYEVRQGAGRISDIVKALKSYAYLDQAPSQMVDLHEGLDNTLIILRHKLKQGITVRRQYDPDLPRIQAYGSDLNQVWTNIIDNAADALNGQGEVTIRTRREGESQVAVEIEDNGPGIPPEIQKRIFDPFFTTKPPGKGTGMGLDISYRIIVRKHRGDIRVESRPGRTCFTVVLPV